MDVFLDYRRRHDAACEITPRAWINFGTATVTHAYYQLRPLYRSALRREWFDAFEQRLREQWAAARPAGPSCDWTASGQSAANLETDSCRTGGQHADGAPPGWPLLIAGLQHLIQAQRAVDPTEHAIAAANSAGLAVRRWAQVQAEREAVAALSPNAPWRDGTPEQAEALRRIAGEGFGRFQALVDEATEFQETGLDFAREGRFIREAHAQHGFYDVPEARRFTASERASPPRPSPPAQASSPSREPPTKVVRVSLPHTSLEHLRTYSGDDLWNLALATVTHALTVVRPHLAHWVAARELNALHQIVDEHWHAFDAGPETRPAPGDWATRAAFLLSQVAYQRPCSGDIEIWRWATTAVHGLNVARYSGDPCGDPLRSAVQQAFVTVYRCAADLHQREPDAAPDVVPAGPFTAPEREALQRTGLGPLGPYENLVLAEMRFQSECLDRLAAGKPITRQEAVDGFVC